MKTKLLLICCLIQTAAFSQYFSGEIHYETKYVAKNNSINIDSVIAENKERQQSIYIITEGKYKSTYYKQGQPTYSYTYDEETKRMYDDRSDQNYITYRDSRKLNYKAGALEVFKDSVIDILGRKSYLVKEADKRFKKRTYYSDDIRVDYEKFQGHLVGNWYAKLKKVNGAIMLKTILEYDEYYEITEAVDIRKRKVSNKEFVIPKHKKIVASFEALDKNVELNQPTQDQILCYQSKIREAVQRVKDFEKTTCYVSFIVAEDGTVSNIGIFEKDRYGFYEVAMNILASCNFTFSAGELDGKIVSSLSVFPVTFEQK